MGIQLKQRDLDRMKGVHPDLVRVVALAAEKSHRPFMVIQGLRTPEEQAQKVAEGLSKTMDSRHLTGHAVDLAPLEGKDIPWKDKAAFKALADVMETAASELGIPLRWGGDWNGNGRSDDERFYDGPHFELPKVNYP